MTPNAEQAAKEFFFNEINHLPHMPVRCAALLTSLDTLFSHA